MDNIHPTRRSHGLQRSEHMLDLTQERKVVGSALSSSTLTVNDLPSDLRSYHGPYLEVSDLMIEKDVRLNPTDWAPLIYVRSKRPETFDAVRLSSGKHYVYREVRDMQTALGGLIGAVFDAENPCLVLAVVVSNAMVPPGSPHQSGEREEDGVYLLRSKYAEGDLGSKLDGALSLFYMTQVEDHVGAI